MIKRSVPDSTKLYVLKENNSACVFCLLSSAFYFIGGKFYADCFIGEITHSLKANERFKSDQDVVLNNVRDKGKPRWKISYKVFK